MKKSSWIKQTRRKVLIPAFTRGLRDGFFHARVAALMALSGKPKTKTRMVLLESNSHCCVQPQQTFTTHKNVLYV